MFSLLKQNCIVLNDIIDMKNIECLLIKNKNVIYFYALFYNKEDLNQNNRRLLWLKNPKKVFLRLL